MSYKRILLKLSGRVFVDYNTDQVKEESAARRMFSKGSFEKICKTISDLRSHSYEVCIVSGAGNILRGAEVNDIIAQPASDYMGMLGTVMNGLALKFHLEEKYGIDTVLMSPVHILGLVEEYNYAEAIKMMKAGKVVIFVFGTGSPFVTTDSAAVLRAVETKCDVVLKATQVDGVYNKDPKKNPDSKKYVSVSYDDVVAQSLGIIDTPAVLMAKRFKVNILVFEWLNSNIIDVLRGKGEYSVICDRTVM